MQAIGLEVIVVISIPVLALTGLAIYKWSDLQTFLGFHLNADVRMEQNNQQHDRRAHLSDTTCSICLSEPKVHEVSSTCGHSFCGECILALYRSHDNQILCPLCRQGISLLFKHFVSSDQTIVLENRIRQYNRIFDDNRSLIRMIKEFPYVMKKLWKKFFQVAFLSYFLRTVQITRWTFIIIFYLLLPLDLIPEKMVGVIGYIDDFLLILFFVSFVMTIAAIRHHRIHDY